MLSPGISALLFSDVFGISYAGRPCQNGASKSYGTDSNTSISARPFSAPAAARGGGTIPGSLTPLTAASVRFIPINFSETSEISSVEPPMLEKSMRMFRVPFGSAQRILKCWTPCRNWKWRSRSASGVCSWLPSSSLKIRQSAAPFAFFRSPVKLTAASNSTLPEKSGSMLTRPIRADQVPTGKTTAAGFSAVIGV